MREFRKPRGRSAKIAVRACLQPGKMGVNHACSPIWGLSERSRSKEFHTPSALGMAQAKLP